MINLMINIFGLKIYKNRQNTIKNNSKSKEKEVEAH